VKTSMTPHSGVSLGSRVEGRGGQQWQGERMVPGKEGRDNIQRMVEECMEEAKVTENYKKNRKCETRIFITSSGPR